MTPQAMYLRSLRPPKPVAGDRRAHLQHGIRVRPSLSTYGAIGPVSAAETAYPNDSYAFPGGFYSA